MRKAEVIFTKEPILVDMDGVFCDFLSRLYDLLQEHHPEIMHLLPEKNLTKQFYLDDCIENEEARQKILDMVNNPLMFKDIKPYIGAIEGLKSLRRRALIEGREVFICTAPHWSNLACYTEKASWVYNYLGKEWMDQLLIVRDKTICNGIVLIDDKPNPLGKFKPAWHHVVFDRSYNRDLPNQPISHRMFDFSEGSITRLLTFIKSLENNKS
jgi:5'-nucleotidase